MAGSLPHEPIDDGETRLFAFVFQVPRGCREAAGGTLSGFRIKIRAELAASVEKSAEAEF